MLRIWLSALMIWSGVVFLNSLFGFINNLVEHCNCKVLILADESNIGKMYANTNIEAKYSTLLSGKNSLKGLMKMVKQ